MIRYALLLLLMFIGTFSASYFISPPAAQAGCCNPVCKAPECGCCSGVIGRCQNHCICVSTSETGNPDDPKTTIGHVTDEFKKHRKWMVDLFFYDAEPNDPTGLRAAMKLMTAQLTTIGIQQIQAIGTFFDAKHQLETQRLFQEMTARAHKDYQPSQELCEFGTIARSLSASYRNADLTAAAIARNGIERQLMADGKTGNAAADSDQKSRLVQFVKKFCNPQDNSGNLNLLCQKSEGKTELFNRDINYTDTIESRLTLDIDLLNGQGNQDDKEAILALTSNLFAHELFPFVSKDKFVKKDGKPDYNAAGKIYLDTRALTAKRSVAMNSVASIAALKTKGDKEAQPFLYALIKEMGGNDISVEDIKRTIGEQPSYHAQMEVLTKKLYQNPKFYSDLYDKPANVLRKTVAIQAATLMQKRDLYRSYLRSEMILAVMLENALEAEQSRITNELKPLSEKGKGRELGN